MYIEPSVTISPAANGGFIITCREEEERKGSKGKMTEPVPCAKDVNYVAEDIDAVITILKDKLPKYAKEVVKDVKRTAMG